jgi:hypothetical protein
MKAGFATISILPPRASLGGVADDRMPRWYTSVLDQPRARAIALEDISTSVVLISANLLDFPAPLTDAVRARFRSRVPGDVELILHGDHTHSGPGNFWPHLLAPKFLGPYMPENLSFLADALAEVAGLAWESRKDASVRWARAVVDGLQVNRRRPDGPTDPQLRVLTFHDENEAAMGAVVHFTAHPRIVAESCDQFWAASGDWPGAVSTALEKEFPCVAVLNGALGGIDPIMPPQPYQAGPALTAFVDPLVAAVRSAIEGAAPAKPFVSFHRSEAVFDRFRADPWPDGFAWWTPLTWPLVRFWDFVASRRIPKPHRVPVSALRIGDIAFVFHPSDYGVGCGIVTRENGRLLGLDAMAVCHADDYAGYIQPADEMDKIPLPRDPYRFFTIYENLMGFHGRDAAKIFAAAEKDALSHVAKTRSRFP